MPKLQLWYQQQSLKLFRKPQALQQGVLQPIRQLLLQILSPPIASNPKDGLYLLNDILKPKDWSKFTGGTCPVFVSLVLADSIRLFKWSTDHWIDVADRGSISRTAPYLNHGSAYLSMVDPDTGEPFIVNYDQLIDRFDVVR